MLDAFKVIFEKVLSQKVILIISICVFIVSVILGFIINLSYFSFSNITNNLTYRLYFVLSRNNSVFSILIKEIFSLILLYLVLALLVFNKFTSYFIYLILIYRGIILGVAFKIYFSIFGLSGIIFFIFLEFIKSLIISFSIIILICLTFDCPLIFKGCFNIKSVFYIVICLMLAILGAICEFILLSCVFRPLNFYVIA